jgi:hypothetical protein
MLKISNKADIIMDPSSIPSRMNVARLYEQYFNAMSRHTKNLVIKHLNSKSDGIAQPLKNYTDEIVFEAFDIVVGLLKILGTEQYDTYSSFQWKDIDSVRYLLQEIVDKELFIYYKISSPKKPYQVVLEAMDTMYHPEMGSVLYMDNGAIKVTKDAMFIAPMYFILLAKTADNFLSTASAKTNHYALPIGVGNKARNNLPWRNSPVKILSETESRLYVSYVSRLALGELKDRGNSIPTHVHIYNKILTAPNPTNIDRLVDRNVCPYGNDSALEIVNNIFNAAGIDITYEHDRSKIHPIVLT